MHLIISAYFIGPETGSVNVFGGLTPNSHKRMISGSLPFNTNVNVLVQFIDTGSNEIEYRYFQGAPPMVSKEYISSASYNSIMAELDATVGTLTGSYTWQKEEYEQ
jgi:hypothetical protein